VFQPNKRLVNLQGGRVACLWKTAGDDEVLTRRKYYLASASTISRWLFTLQTQKNRVGSLRTNATTCKYEGSSGRRTAYLVIPWARGLKLAHKTKRPSQYWRGTLGRTALPRVCSQAT